MLHALASFLMTMKIIYTSPKYKPKKKSKKPKGEVFEKRTKKAFTPLKPKPTREKTAFDLAPSRDSGTHVEPTRYPVYEGDMAERERLAQEEIEKKKKRVGILVNKSTYQYIGDMDMDMIKCLGKK